MDTLSIEKHRRAVGIVFLILGMVLVVGWIIAVLVSWDNIISTHTRLGYLFGDIGIVVPLSFLTWYGFRKGRGWAPMAFLFLAGASAYDVLHFGIYLIQEKFLHIPGIIYGILIVVSLGILIWLSLWEIRVQSASGLKMRTPHMETNPTD